jgi:AraC-like DNA-binding protein
MTATDKHLTDHDRQGPQPAIPLNTAVVPALVGAALAGVDTDAMLADLGIDRGILGDPDRPLPPAQSSALWREAMTRSRDPALALHAAEAVPFGHFDVVDYVAGEAPDLGEGLAALARYFRLVRKDFDLRFAVAADEGRLSLVVPASFGPVVPYMTEFTLGCIVTRFRLTVGVAWAPRVIEFAYPRPAHVAEYERLFACPLRFDAGLTVVRLAPATLALPQPRADARLRLVLERAAAAVLERLPPSPGLVTRLREILAEELRGGTPTLEHVARRLATGARTLGRRLQDEGTSFQDQLDRVRHELACRYLDDRRLAVAEVAYLLGFSEPSAFHRAFRRWTGQAPQAWRSAR